MMTLNIINIIFFVIDPVAVYLLCVIKRGVKTTLNFI